MRSENGQSLIGRGRDFILRHVPKQTAYPLLLGLSIVGGAGCAESREEGTDSSTDTSQATFAAPEDSVHSGETTLTPPPSDFPAPFPTLELPNIQALAVEPQDEEENFLSAEEVGTLDIPPFLHLPFEPNSQMKIVQGWTSDYNPKHNAMDIAEVLNDGTWDNHPLLSPADGDACANPRDRQGNAVLIRHTVEGKEIWTYLGHLEKIEIVTICGTGTEPVKTGQKIGEAGATGVIGKDGKPRPTWIHTHLRVFIKNADGSISSIDAFDLRTTAENYPAINGQNPQIDTSVHPCGPNALFIDCFSDNSPDTTPAPSPEQPAEGWETFQSPYHGYTINHPSSWQTSTGAFYNSGQIVEYFDGPVIEHASTNFGIESEEIGFVSDLNIYMESLRLTGWKINSLEFPNDPIISALSNIEIDGKISKIAYSEYKAGFDDPNYAKLRLVFDNESGRRFNVEIVYGADIPQEEKLKLLDILVPMLSSMELSNSW